MKFNPTVRELMEEKKEITVIGLYWAGFWRLYLLVIAGAFVIGILSELYN